MLEMLFDVFPFQLIFHWFCVSQVVQKQTMGEVEYWTIIWWPVVAKIFVP